MTITLQEYIGKNIKFLPSLPTIVSQLLAVTSDPESDVNDILAVILPDQSMCAAILNIANSAFFGMSQQVATLERAIVVLGHREIRNIVIGRAVFNAFPQLNTIQNREVSLFWERSFYTALLTMIIGNTSAPADAGELFIAGLIHDIGKLPLLITYPEEYILTRDLDDPYQGEREKELYGVTHSELGLYLTRKWLFPESLVTASGFHHQPEKAPDNKFFPTLIHLTDAIVILTLREEVAAQEIYPRLFAYMPETLNLLTRYQIVVTPEKIEKWLVEMEEHAEKDKYILDLLAA